MPQKRIIREIVENAGSVSESVEVTVTRRVIIPPKFTNRKLRVNYFIPRFKKVTKGEDMEWVNLDSNTHHLKFFEVLDNQIKFLFGFNLHPNKTFKKKFDFDIPRIDYHCTLHQNEIGTIIVYSKPENQMTNVEQFQFLSKIFDIIPPSSLSHLGSV